MEYLPHYLERKIKMPENKIALESSIWDLHIHTCKSDKSSGDFKDLTVVEYIDKLCKLFANYPLLRLISFTDHNAFNKDVYDEFLSRKTNIQVLPGIEVDLYLNEDGKKNNDYKHIIVYFDPNKFDFDVHGKSINEFLKEGKPILYNFLEHIIEFKIPFTLSPHFMKQGGRGIEYNWPSEEDYNKNLHKYIDQFFSFLEASGITSISHAEEALKQFDCGEKISVISFSDSCSFEKLEGYLNQPHQYFNALPSYEGLRMVGSDCRRIVKNPDSISTNDYGKFIGEIKVNGESLKTSAKLNSIIGGRGSGKSILLDGIALNSGKDIDIKDDRKEFVISQNIEAFDLNGNSLGLHSFSLDYYNQGCIIDIFNKKTQISDYKIFDNEFSALHVKTKEEIIADLKEKLNFKIKTKASLTDNLSAITSSINYLISETKKLNICKPTLKKTKFEYALINSIKQKILNSVDEELRTDDFYTSLSTFLKELANIIHSHNINEYGSYKFKLDLHKAYSDSFDKKDESNKKTSKTLKNIEKAFNNLSVPYINKVNIVNKYIKLNKKFISLDKDKNDIKCLGEHIITFAKETKIQSPLEYLHDVLSASIKGAIPGCDKNKICDLPKIVKFFVENDNIYVANSSLDVVIDKLSNFTDLKIVTKDKIYFYDGSKIIDLETISPGSRANILLEYIVSKNSSIPLLIDQPEDNIDNKTIYLSLTDWFSKLKTRRQIFVATHDANIVVNADSENVIVCRQNNDETFTYTYGALEYDKNLNDVSSILDGGSKAIKRRLLKYGD